MKILKGVFVSLRDQLKEEIKAEILSSMEKDLLKDQIIKELREDFEIYQKGSPALSFLLFGVTVFLVAEGIHRLFM